MRWYSLLISLLILVTAGSGLAESLGLFGSSEFFRKPIEPLEGGRDGSTPKAITYGLRDSTLGVELKGTALHGPSLENDQTRLTLESLGFKFGAKNENFIGLPLGIQLQRNYERPMGISLVTVRPLLGLMGRFETPYAKFNFFHHTFYVFGKMRGTIDTEKVEFRASKLYQTEISATMSLFTADASVSLGQYNRMEGVFSHPMGDLRLQVGSIPYTNLLVRKRIFEKVVLLFGGNRAFREYDDKNLLYIVGARYLEKSRDSIFVGFEY